MRVVAIATFVSAMVVGGCSAPGRSVRAWVEARDSGGDAIAGATVTLDGRPVGITDHRGLFRVKLRRQVGATVAVHVLDDHSEPEREWAGTFTVGTSGGPAGVESGRILAVLEPARQEKHPRSPEAP